jgi:hypothetical protein
MPYADREKRLEYAHRWNKEHYKNNVNSEKKRIYTRRRKISEWFTTYKDSLSCHQCGESASICLDFHHTDPHKKDINLGRVKNWGYSIERIQAEMNKCIVLCANCHRKIHANLIKLK